MAAIELRGLVRPRSYLASQGAMPRYFVIAVVAVVALLYWPATVEMVGKWHNSVSYSHGFLLAPIAIWFALEVPAGRRPFESKLPLSFVMLTLVFGAIWFGGYLGNMSVIQMLALPVLIWCGLSLVYGSRVAPAFVIPIGLLYFGVPIWDYGNFVLQDATTFAVGILLDLSHRTAVIDGNFVLVRAGTFEIASGCSGLHFFVVALALALIYGYQHLTRTINRIRLIALGGILALVANWIRVFLIVLAGDLTDMQHFLVTVDHYYFGWLVFVLILVPFFFYARYLYASEHQDFAKNSTKLTEEPGENHKATTYFGARQFVRAGGALVVLAMWPILASMTSNSVALRSTLPISPPSEISNWTKSEDGPLVGSWTPVFVGATQEYLGSFSDGVQVVDIYMNLYESESEGEELIGYENGWYDRDIWYSDGSRRTSINDDKQNGSWSFIYIRSGGRSRVVLASYVVGKRFLADELSVKIAGLFDRIIGPTVSGAIAVSAPCMPNCETTSRRLEEFVESGIWILRDSLIYSLAKP